MQAQTESDGSTDESSNTTAWTQRAFPSAKPSHADAASGGGSQLVAVQPQALDEHAPALVGPLPLTAAGGGPEQEDPATSLQDFAEAADAFVDVTLLR